MGRVAGKVASTTLPFFCQRKAKQDLQANVLGSVLCHVTINSNQSLKDVPVTQV